MKQPVLLGALLVLALLISACGPAATGTPAQVTEPPAQATEPEATASPLATDSSAATASPDASPAVTESATATQSAAGTQSATGTSDSASIPVTGDVVVRAAANFDYGPILVDEEGLPLYIFSSDTQNGDTSACADEACTTNWPPLTTEASATAGPGAIQSLLGTITREDGTTQVTYNGWPLYHYSGDTSPDTTNGQGAEPGWTLVSSAGKPIPAQ